MYYCLYSILNIQITHRLCEHLIILTFQLHLEYICVHIYVHTYIYIL